MGSMVKFDSERRELVRERRNARLERKLERRQARERKQSQTADAPSARSATQLLAEREVQAAVDRIVIDTLDRHERIATPATPPDASTRLPEMPEPELARTTTLPLADGGERAPRRSRRERDLAAFRERRRQRLEEARGEARARIARAGELASVADAFAALGHPEAAPWGAERDQLEAAIATGRFVEVGAAARRAMWAISRDAARTSPAAPGATPTSRWRRVSPTRSSPACRAPRCAAHSAPSLRTDGYPSAPSGVSLDPREG